MESFEGREQFEEVAIIGVAGRFPGAPDVDTFWQNLCNGVESITHFSDKELAEHVDADLLHDSHYVKAGFVLDHIDQFDAAFFDFTPRQAQVTDPQLRLLLECAWESLEYAAIDPLSFDGAVGVYVGANNSTYYMHQLFEQVKLDSAVNNLQVLFGNDRDYLATQIGYKLNLRGPCVCVQTACSTSLVAVHMACQSLLNLECDVALAGGAAVRVPHRIGYLYEEGGIFSLDGHCRAFDAHGEGSAFGNGVGVVALKRLSEAVADGDTILAVIKGSAINNDGADKIGYSAPSVNGQAKAIAEALAVADITPDTIGYVETHGTATPLGDPIELAALTQVYRASTPRQQFCAIGSVKTNVSHLDAAAGVTGLIKTVLALHHKILPPSLYYKTPNAQIDFANSPFYVNAELATWNTNGAHPRRAGVSSFGMGGTNAHVVLEEAPTPVLAVQHAAPPRSHHLLTLSAKSEAALVDMSARYATYLATVPATQWADICHTAQTGRAHFAHRLGVIAANPTEAHERLQAFRDQDAVGLIQGQAAETPPKVAFLFTGQGAQYLNMGYELYKTQPSFRRTLDRCDEILRPYLQQPLLSVLYPGDEATEEARARLNETTYTQPALFAVEYALAELWQSWGVTPDVVIGHSNGEYMAACVAGVFSLEDGLRLVAERGRLMQSLPQTGEMLAALASEAQVQAVLQSCDAEVSLAVVNAPQNVVLSGTAEAIQAAAKALRAARIMTSKLKIFAPAHSHLLEPMLPAFAQVVQGMTFHAPRIKVVSNLTGTLVDEQLTTPDYWCRHLRGTVRFADGMATLQAMNIRAFVEMGPEPILLGMGRQCLTNQRDEAGTEENLWLPSLRPARPDWMQILESVAALHVHGYPINWSNIANDSESGRARRKVTQRVPLPTYPFQRQRHWVEKRPHGQNGKLTKSQGHTLDASKADNPQAEWLYQIGWQPSPRSQVSAYTQTSGRWLIFADSQGVGTRLAAQLEARGETSTLVLPQKVHTNGHAPSHDTQSTSPIVYIDPTDPAAYAEVLQHVHAQRQDDGAAPAWRGVIYLWALDSDAEAADQVPAAAQRYCTEVLHLVQSLIRTEISPRLWLVTRDAVVPTTKEQPTTDLQIQQAPLWGLGRSINLEHPELKTTCIDLAADASAQSLFAEVWHSDSENQIVLTQGLRQIARLERYQPDAPRPLQIHADLSYLVTGGLGGLGLELARWLVDQGARRLVLTSRRGVATARVQQAMQTLEEAGAKIRIVQADVARQDDVTRLLAESQALAPLAGIFHLAGVSEYGALLRQTAAHFANVLAPKVLGSWHLHRATAEMDLDFMVYFSSGAALLGLGWNGSYAAANGFMDALAQQRRCAGLPALSINWGPWAEVGMTATDTTDGTATRPQDSGMMALSTAHGLQLLGDLMAQDATQVGVMAMNWPKFLQQLPVDGDYPLLANWLDHQRARQPTSSVWLQRLHETESAHRPALIVAYLQEQIEALLGLNPDQRPEAHQSTIALGLDSLLNIELSNRIKRDLAIRVPIVKFLEGDSLAQMSEYMNTLKTTQELQRPVASPTASAAMEREEGRL